MDVTIETMPELRVACVPYVGAYTRIAEAFARLDALAEPAGLLNLPETKLIAIYYDDPKSTSADQLRSAAAIAVPQSARLPDGLSEQRLPAGRYARATHVGPYTALGEAWSWLMAEWLPRNGHRIGAGSRYEIYRNTPENTQARALRTDLYLPLA